MQRERFQQQECQDRYAKNGGSLKQQGKGKRFDGGFDIHLERLAVGGVGMVVMPMPRQCFETQMRIDRP